MRDRESEKRIFRIETMREKCHNQITEQELICKGTQAEESSAVRVLSCGSPETIHLLCLCSLVAIALNQSVTADSKRKSSVGE